MGKQRQRSESTLVGKVTLWIMLHAVFMLLSFISKQKMSLFPSQGQTALFLLGVSKFFQFTKIYDYVQYYFKA